VIEKLKVNPTYPIIAGDTGAIYCFSNPPIVASLYGAGLSNHQSLLSSEQQ